MSPKKPSQDVETLDTFDPCEHAYDYIDGDGDDYKTGEDYDNADSVEDRYGGKGKAGS